MILQWNVWNIWRYYLKDTTYTTPWGSNLLQRSTIVISGTDVTTRPSSHTIIVIINGSIQDFIMTIIVKLIHPPTPRFEPRTFGFRGDDVNHWTNEACT